MITQTKFEKVSFEQFYKDYIDLFNKGHICLFSNEINKDFIKEIYDNIELPTRATSKSAGYDFKMPFSYTFTSVDKCIIPTGIRCTDMEDDMVLMIYPRSSLGFKYGFKLNNTVGIIDADYAYANNEGHIMICVRTDENCTIEQGKSFCQGIFQKYYTTKDDTINITRIGGIGSTDKK